jgi:hypothetical protein
VTADVLPGYSRFGRGGRERRLFRAAAVDRHRDLLGEQLSHICPRRQFVYKVEKKLINTFASDRNQLH